MTTTKTTKPRNVFGRTEKQQAAREARLAKLSNAQVLALLKGGK